MTQVNKNVLVLLGAAELCCRSLRADGFHADYMTLSHNRDSHRHACIVAVARTKSSATRFARSRRLDRLSTKGGVRKGRSGVVAWMWIREDMTLYTVCPEVLQEGALAARAVQALHALAIGMSELVPHYPSVEVAALSQLALRQEVAVVEPMLRATPRTLHNQDLN